MKLAIVGSRTFNDFSKLETFIKSKIDISKITTIISGGARGADTLAEQFAGKYGIDLKVFHAAWDTFGKRAGYIRNKDIVDNCDVLIAFWDDISKGTKHSIDLADESNKEHYVCYF